MYLNRLSTEQKELFLDLCIHAAMANNDFADEEKNVIDQYCAEMQISQPRYTSEKAVDVVVEELKELSTPQEMKMILLEITALMLSDDVYDVEEKAFMKAFLDRIGFNKKILDEMVVLLQETRSLYRRIDCLIME